MRRVWSFVLSWAAVLVMLYGALFLAAAAADAYMVAFGGLKPGDLLWGYPAAPLGEALIEVGIGAGIVAVGFWVRVYARRLRLADS